MQSRELSYIEPRQVRGLKNFDSKEFEALSRLGINLTADTVDRMMSAMDAIQPSITTASIATPVQFLQNWLPGFVYVMTGARKIDELTGIMTTGAWEDEEVVQGVLERVGSSQPYGDITNIPLSSWNVNFERRTVVRFEEGMRSGRLESARSARMNVDNAGAKRQSAALALEIIRNTIGFSGYNAGANRTYGFLNDPNLPAYVNVPNGAGGSPLWANKTFLEIQKDIRDALAALRNQSQDIIDPETLPITLAIATSVVDMLSTTTDLGLSVRDWMRKAYPNIRVVSAPQLNSANGGANVFYLYAERVMDESTDDQRVFIQPVPAKFQVLGVQQMAKAYEEDYSNATAGIMLKRPWAVVRRSGV